MDKRLTDACDVAAAGLRSDAELYLEVRRELESHLEAAAQEAKHEGQSEAEAVDSALQHFGSPSELADTLLSANRRKMQWRARIRIAAVILLPLAAMILVGTMAQSEWRYWRINTWYWRFSGNDYTGKILNAAGIDTKRLSPKEHALLYNNWLKLLEQEPGNPAWSTLAYQKSISDNQHGWSNGKPIYIEQVISDQLDQAYRNDPDNAMIDYATVLNLLYQGSIMTGQQHKVKLVDQTKIMEALPYFISGVRKKRYCSYEDYTNQQRMTMSHYVSDNRSTIWDLFLCAGLSYNVLRDEYLTPALPFWGEELIKSGQPEIAEQVLDCWQLFTAHILEDNSFHSIHAISWSLRDWAQTLPPLYRKIGRTKKAEQVGYFLNRVSNRLLCRYAKNNKNPEREQIKAELHRYAGSRQQYLGNYLVTGEYNLKNLTTGRQWDYLNGDRIILQIAMIMLSALLLGSGLAWLIIRRRLRQELSPSLFAPSWAELGKLTLYGIVLPLGIWYTIIILPWGGREFALDYNAVNYLAQSVFLLLSLTIWPVILLHYTVARHGAKLGLTGISASKREYLLFPAVLLLLTAAAGWLPWGDQFIKLSALVPNYFELDNYGWQRTFAIYGFSAMAILFWGIVMLDALRYHENRQRLFNAGAKAATTMVGTAVLILLLGGLSEVIMEQQSRQLCRQDPFIERNIYHPLRLKIASDYQKYLKQELATLPPVTAPKIDFAVCDKVLFPRAVVSASEKRIEDAVKIGADVNAVDELGQTALMLACRYRDAKVVELLLKNGAKVETWCPPKQYSVGKRHAPPIPEMLTGADALMIAAYYNPNPDVIRVLLKYGADPKRQAQNGYSRDGATTFLIHGMTALMFAAINNNPEVVQALIDSGIKINEQKNHFTDTLERASLDNPDPKVAQLLYRNGATFSNPDRMIQLIPATGGYGQQVIDSACRRLQTAISVGFDPKRKDRQGKTVMDYARKNYELRQPAAIKRLEDICRQVPTGKH